MIPANNAGVLVARASCPRPIAAAPLPRHAGWKPAPRLPQPPRAALTYRRGLVAYPELRRAGSFLLRGSSPCFDSVFGVSSLSALCRVGRHNPTALSRRSISRPASLPSASSPRRTCSPVYGAFSGAPGPFILPHPAEQVRLGVRVSRARPARFHTRRICRRWISASDPTNPRSVAIIQLHFRGVPFLVLHLCLPFHLQDGPVPRCTAHSPARPAHSSCLTPRNRSDSGCVSARARPARFHTRRIPRRWISASDPTNPRSVAIIQLHFCGVALLALHLCLPFHLQDGPLSVLPAAMFAAVSRCAPRRAGGTPAMTTYPTRTGGRTICTI